MANKCKFSKKEIKAMENALDLAHELADDPESIKDVNTSWRMFQKIKKGCL